MHSNSTHKQFLQKKKILDGHYIGPLSGSSSPFSIWAGEG